MLVSQVSDGTGPYSYPISRPFSSFSAHFTHATTHEEAVPQTSSSDRMKTQDKEWSKTLVTRCTQFASCIKIIALKSSPQGCPSSCFLPKMMLYLPLAGSGETNGLPVWSWASGKGWERRTLNRHTTGEYPHIGHLKQSNHGNELWSWLLTCCLPQWELHPSTANLPFIPECSRGHWATFATAKGNLTWERPIFSGKNLPIILYWKTDRWTQCLLLVTIF